MIPNTITIEVPIDSNEARNIQKQVFGSGGQTGNKQWNNVPDDPPPVSSDCKDLIARLVENTTGERCGTDFTLREIDAHRNHVTDVYRLRIVLQP